VAERNAIQRAIDEFAQAGGMVKQSGSWYLTRDEVTVLVNLQKSQYSSSYYLNVGFWFAALAENRFPKEQECHVRVLAELLIPAIAAELKELLDLQTSVPDADRQRRLQAVLSSELLPVLELGSSLKGVRDLRGRGSLQAAAVRGPALPLLNQG
jgi:hypothetical protein